LPFILLQNSDKLFEREQLLEVWKCDLVLPFPPLFATQPSPLTKQTNRGHENLEKTRYFVAGMKRWTKHGFMFHFQFGDFFSTASRKKN